MRPSVKFGPKLDLVVLQVCSVVLIWAWCGVVSERGGHRIEDGRLVYVLDLHWKPWARGHQSRKVKDQAHACEASCVVCPHKGVVIAHGEAADADQISADLL